MSGSDEADETSVRRGFQVKVTTELVTLPGGQRLELAIVKHPGAAAMVPFITDDEVLLIRQYRHATRETIWEVPAGKLDPGESPEVCAVRELEEEAGQHANRIEKLGQIWTTPGFSDEVIHLFAAFDLVAVESRLEDDEIIEIVPTRLASALDLVWRGEISDAKSALAILYAARHVGALGSTPP